MARTKAIQRKYTGGGRRVWHPALTRAAEEGGQELLDEALRARAYASQHVQHVTDMSRPALQHSAAVLPDGTPASAVPQSPFPALSCFGMAPYTTWHGHPTVLLAFLDRQSPVDGLAEVLVESYPKRWALEGLQLESRCICYTDGALSDGVRVTALQIAHFKFDADAVGVLLERGAQLAHPFLLHIIKPLPASLFASKAGTWTRGFHGYMPLEFRAAVVELLRISHRHGGTVRSGRLVWPFGVDELSELLLPLLGSDVAPWLDVSSREGFVEIEEVEEA